jgi:hypothetical protein
LDVDTFSQRSFSALFQQVYYFQPYLYRSRR